MIGFFLKSIDDLVWFKETIQKYPQFDYGAYIDENNEIAASMSWFEAKKAVVVITKEKNEDSHLIPVISISELDSFLSLLEPKAGQGSGRDIYITESNEAQDRAIAALLGGVFVDR